LVFSSNCALFGGNVHQVSSDFFRSAQLKEQELRKVVNRRNIETVINLRGSKPGREWYETEKKVCEDLNIDHYDLRFSASSLPRKEQILKLVRYFRISEYPILVHCQGGADRSGLASSVYELVINEKDLDESIKQLSIRFGHLKLFNPEMDHFFQLYEKHGKDKEFLDWVKEDYSRARYEKECNHTFLASD